MFELIVKIYHNHYDGDKSYHTEKLYVNGNQLQNWLRRGNTHDVEIISYRFRG